MYLLILLFDLFAKTQQQDTMGALLLYEDGREVDFYNGEKVNFLTLKRKIHPEVKQIKDFTLCS